jgi:hypothetical protein
MKYHYGAFLLCFQDHYHPFGLIKSLMKYESKFVVMNIITCFKCIGIAVISFHGCSYGNCERCSLVWNGKIIVFIQ